MLNLLDANEFIKLSTSKMVILTSIKQDLLLRVLIRIYAGTQQNKTGRRGPQRNEGNFSLIANDFTEPSTYQEAVKHK